MTAECDLVTGHGAESVQLMRRAQRGEPEAREVLLERQLSKLRVYVQYRLGRALARSVEAEDVVQETLLRAWRGFDGAGLESEASFRGWVLTIARNVLADVARSARAAKRDGGTRQVDPASWSRSDDHSRVDMGPGPRTLALRGEARDRLVEAFRGLGPRQRRVIALRHIEGRPAREVALSLGCTEGAVHALFRRALTAWGAEIDRLGGGSVG